MKEMRDIQMYNFPFGKHSTIRMDVKLSEDDRFLELTFWDGDVAVIRNYICTNLPPIEITKEYKA